MILKQFLEGKVVVPGGCIFTTSKPKISILYTVWDCIWVFKKFVVVVGLFLFTLNFTLKMWHLAQHFLICHSKKCLTWKLLEEKILVMKHVCVVHPLSSSEKITESVSIIKIQRIPTKMMPVQYGFTQGLL